jgi:Protein of unknown function (DUF1194)
MSRINLVASALGRFFTAASGVAFLAWIAVARAEPMDSAPAVDLELILAADVSGSMTKDELRIQREGYVNALRNADVINAALSGTRGRIAIKGCEEKVRGTEHFRRLQVARRNQTSRRKFWAHCLVSEAKPSPIGPCAVPSALLPPVRLMLTVKLAGSPKETVFTVTLLYPIGNGWPPLIA